MGKEKEPELFNAVDIFRASNFKIIDEILKRLNMVPVEKQLHVLVNLLPYVLPKIRPVETNELYEHRARNNFDRNAKDITKLYWKAHKEVNGNNVEPIKR